MCGFIICPTFIHPILFFYLQHSTALVPSENISIKPDYSDSFLSQSWIVMANIPQPRICLVGTAVQHKQKSLKIAKRNYAPHTYILGFLLL